MKKLTTITFIVILALTFTQCKNRASSPASSGNVGVKIGDVAPEIEQPDPDGRMIALSSLRGKMVLVDFWAGWCPPCRMENPHLVSVYKKYKDSQFTTGEGFAIYSVSLDQSRETWVQAIETDQLEWQTHVSDLKYWYSVPAATYQVQSIPANFLLDRNGVILATGLRGEMLEQTLRKYLK